MGRSAGSAFCLPTSLAPFQYGGQAVIEGVVMRGPRRLAIAVRRSDGEIVVVSHPAPEWATRYPALKWPVVRGVVALLESVVIGIKALFYSASVAAEEEGEELGTKELVLALVLAAGLAGLFFVVVPTLLGHFSAGRFGPLGQNLLESAVRLGLLVGYIGAISVMDDVRRLFAYHGAEHKVIHTWEAGAALEAESAKAFSRLHPRCGTSFVLVVLVLAVFFYSLVDAESLAERLLIRASLLPLLAGVGYEVLKWSSRRAFRAPLRFLIVPGLALQRLTTREPDERQLEVAIAALEAVLEEKEVRGNAGQTGGD